MRCFALTLLLPACLAFQLPFRVPFFTKNVTADELDQPTVVKGSPRIAIIGAGAGGSSAAFWISKAKERFGVDVEVDVYEREDYIGGRSTVVYPYGNTSLPPLELGGSIFVAANKNLWRASDEFNLTRREFDAGAQTGVWDGHKLVFSFGDGWWDTIKVILRYGMLSPKNADSLVSGVIKNFLTLYSSATPKWDNIADLAATLGWSDLVSNTTADFFTQRGVSKKFTYEVIEAATRVNYGQNVDAIQALEGACSLATTGARGIEGGNYQLFERFLNHSGANVHLNTKVVSVTEASSSSHHWAVKTSAGTVEYKAVILAAPFHSTGIEISPSLAAQIPKQQYVHLHVTLLATTSPTPDPAYFGLPAGAKLPNMMLTTYEGARAGGKEPEFNSLSYHGQVREGEWAVKIFSKDRISDEWLNKLFLGKVGWVLRKEWDAYPQLPPTTVFPPVKLDRGFYYVNAFEPLISTMETETIASRNVVDLLLNEEFGSSICGSRISPSDADEAHTAGQTTSNDKDFVIGWDC
ncbi:Farnesylcysteine lyase [Hypsizygus marmoreus]|uniref:Farnesylcysteine lyase n=1 Tax=Hypsizygus marmoreus TaxID=39966 RepID=A0A369K1D6_HYPMA|nr:Farnesylcysteine lyase [Hypsizygus marmoreus]